MSARSPRGRRASGAPSGQTADSWGREQTAALIPVPHPSDDKYLRGVLGVRTGSAAYPGAAVLNTSAAWRTGLGMLRYVPPLVDPAPAYGLPSPAAAVLAAHPETVFGSGQVSAWLLGSGTDPGDRSNEEREALAEILRGDIPVVVDAGALELAVEVAREAFVKSSQSQTAQAPTSVAPEIDTPAPQALPPRVLTPHHGEFLRLWKAAGLGGRPQGWPVRGRSGRTRQPRPGVLTDAALQLAAKTGATVLLKGSVTVAATPGGLAYLAGPATPWLATAGTGDVLAGILGALVTGHADAVREDPELLGPLAATAAVLHDTAARLASGDIQDEVFGGGPITALDVAVALPKAIAQLRTEQSGTEPTGPE